MATAGLKERAIRLLARRDHSRAELARKLAVHGDAEAVEDAMARMDELGLVDDRRYAEAWIRGKAARFGAARLRHDLAQRGIDQDTIEAALQAEQPDSELDRAREIWRARYGESPADRREWARQARFLQSRGFSSSIIAKLLKERPDESA